MKLLSHGSTKPGGGKVITTTGILLERLQQGFQGLPLCQTIGKMYLGADLPMQSRVRAWEWGRKVAEERPSVADKM